MFWKGRPVGFLRTAISRLHARLDPFLEEDLHPLFRESPFVIYDVGAAGNLFNPFPGRHFDLLKIYGFEPTAESFHALERKYAGKPWGTICQVALCDRDDTVSFNLSQNGPITHSSLVDLSARGICGETVEVEGARLDSVPSRYGFPAADFIKLDTEGSELTILKEGLGMLGTEVMGAFIEISFWHKGTAGAHFHEIDKLMNDHGFILFDLQINRSHISGIGGKKAKVRSGDALYLRDFAHFHAGAGASLTEDRLRLKLYKLISLCLSWCYLEYAVELLDFGRRDGLVGEDEFRRLVRQWSSVVDVANRIPDFPGRLRLARVFDRLSYALHRKAKKKIPEPFDGTGNPWGLTMYAKPRNRLRIKDPIFQEDGNAGIKTLDLGGSDTAG
jgi:FkbM family methyltransferase